MQNSTIQTEDATFRVSFFTGVKDNEPKVGTINFPEYFSEYETAKSKAALKKDGALWSPALYEKGTTRANDNFLEAQLLGFDVDDGMTYQQAMKALDALDIDYVLHSSFSSTPEHHKFRIVVPLIEAVDKDTYKQLWAAFNHILGGSLDKKTKDPARILYTPVCPDDGEPVYWYGEGSDYVDPEDFLKKHPVPAAKKHLKNKPGMDLSTVPTDTDKYLHLDLPLGTTVADKNDEADLYQLEQDALDDEGGKWRVFCPFHNGTSGEPSAFVVQYADHWTLVCPTCETIWHASKALGAALKLNDELVYIETLDRVYDLEHREFLSTEVIKRRGAGFRAWMNKGFDEYRRRAVGLEFFPGLPSNGKFNTYDADVVMKADDGLDDCPKVLERLVDNLVADDNEWAYLMQWLAYKLQNPDSGSQVALVLQGAQGTGKGLLFRLLEKVWGKYVVQVDGAALESDFNGFLHEKLLVVGNEVGSDFFSNKRRAATKMKGWVVGDNLRINMKNIREFVVRNPTSWILCSNDGVPICIDKGDRRYTVLQSKTPLRVSDPSLIPEYLDALTCPSFIQQVVNYLSAIDLTGFDHAMPMDNVARAEVQKSSLRSNELWWDDECPQDGVYPVDLVYKEYRRWAKEDQGESRPVPKVVFGQTLPPGVTRKKVRPSSVHSRYSAFMGKADKVRCYVIDRGKASSKAWKPEIMDDDFDCTPSRRYHNMTAPAIN